MSKNVYRSLLKDLEENPPFGLSIEFTESDTHNSATGKTDRLIKVESKNSSGEIIMSHAQQVSDMPTDQIEEMMVDAYARLVSGILARGMYRSLNPDLK